MPFCVSCGKPVTGAFCTHCGAALKSSGPVSSGPAAAAPAAAAPAAAKSTSPIVWILGIVGVIFVLTVVAIIGGGLFIAHKVKQAGFDPDLWQKNPGLAATKMIAAVNPDVSVVSVNEGKGLITLKDKKTGETVTLNFDDVKNGRISLQGKGGEKVTMEAHGDGSTGSLEVKSSEGSVKFGAGTNVKIPGWIPSYPGSTPEANFSAKSNAGETGSFHFVTKDALAKVQSFYEQSLKQGGFQITSNISGQSEGQTGGVMVAEDSANKRKVVVTSGSSEQGTTINVLFEAKP